VPHRPGRAWRQRSRSGLKRYVEKITFNAEDGQPGRSNRRVGLNGKDLILQVPNGTTIIDKETGEEVELNLQNPQILLSKGGIGGRGNDAFKSSTHQTPRHAEPGKAAKERHLKLIQKLIADYGLIGLPNAGKSSLLNVLTAANVRTAPYPFTTLEPNLGAYYGKVIADIPGLIEGASGGKGLGIKFLRHIEKVKLLLHCISAESEDVEKDYKTVIKELAQYNESLTHKKSVILLTKIDLATPEEVQKKLKILHKFNENVIPLTILDDATLVPLKKIL
jgi:GTP-binding protein